VPFLKLNFRPGISRDTTNYSNEGGWYECDKIRFFSGFPQKLGGWVRSSPYTFLGVCRQICSWATSYADSFLALGTNIKVYIEAGAVFFDITPLRTTLATPATNNCVSTTSGSSVVTITVTGHGCTTGDYVTISGVTGTVGGIPNSEINAEHEVTVLNVNAFTITVATAASSTVASGGGTAISIACQISTGPAVTEYGYGWGAGSWNANIGWGTSSSSPINYPQRDWWFDNFDNDLVMNIRRGPIYYWERGSISDATTALSTRAVLLSDLVGANSVPNRAMQVLVSQNDKHLLALGCQPYAGGVNDYDPLLIRWANQDEPQVWNPTTLNSAGFLRVSRGSQIVRGLATRQETLIWTDTHLYSLQFLGNTDVFSLQELADNISIISPRAVTTASNTSYWMGLDKFYIYNGQIQTLPCTLREYVFKDLNYNQIDQIVCGTNEGFNEVWWFYPSGNSGWNNRYVVFNYLEQVWYYGQLGRTGWLDTPLRSYPVAVFTGEGETSGRLYNHEVGIDADGEPLPAFIQSSDFDLQDGEQFMLTRRILPDINFTTSTAATPEVTLTVRPRNFPGGSYYNKPTNTQRVIETSVNIYTDEVFVRARARQMALKVASENLGVQWQLGSPRLDVRQDGKK
jgi:hypothetical protein